MRIGLFKFTFRTSGAMHLAAERLVAFASQNPTLMSHNDPPLVLWTDEDLVDGRSLYTTEIGRRFITTVINNAPPSVVLSPEDLPPGVHFVCGDERFRAAAVSGQGVEDERHGLVVQIHHTDCRKGSGWFEVECEATQGFSYQQHYDLPCPHCGLPVIRQLPGPPIDRPRKIELPAR